MEFTISAHSPMLMALSNLQQKEKLSAPKQKQNPKKLSTFICIPKNRTE